jgi:hypothetical protein
MNNLKFCISRLGPVLLGIGEFDLLRFNSQKYGIHPLQQDNQVNEMIANAMDASIKTRMVM